MCFTVNVIEYDASKILFGTFNDSTWLIEPDKKKPVNIQNIMVRFKNSEVYTDKVEKGYIIYSKSLSDVQFVELYDDKGKLQSDLNDLRRYGSKMKLKYEPVWKRFRKRTNGYFYPGAGHELHCSLRPVESVDNGESNSQGVALAENCLPSASNAGAKGIQVQFDAQVKSEESIIKIESAQTKKGSSESLNLIVPKEAEAKKPVTGLLKTTLDITPENDALKLDFSLQNIAEQDLSLSFSSSQKFDILITNQNGEEVYRWSHDKAFYGHCGC